MEFKLSISFDVTYNNNRYNFVLVDLDLVESTKTYIVNSVIVLLVRKYFYF
jgi:hypothetical protein